MIEARTFPVDIGSLTLMVPLVQSFLGSMWGHVVFNSSELSGEEAIVRTIDSVTFNLGLKSIAHEKGDQASTTSQVEGQSTTRSGRKRLPWYNLPRYCPA